MRELVRSLPWDAELEQCPELIFHKFRQGKKEVRRAGDIRALQGQGLGELEKSMPKAVRQSRSKSREENSVSARRVPP